MGHGLHAQALQRLTLAYEGTNHTGLLAAMHSIFGEVEEEPTPEAPPAKKARTAEAPASGSGSFNIYQVWDERAAKSALGLYPTTADNIAAFGVENVVPKPTKGTPTREYECPICKEDFSGRVGLISHIRRHYGVALACVVCKQQYWNSNNFQAHLKKEHPGIDVYALARQHMANLPPIEVSGEVQGNEDPALPRPPPRAPTATVSRPPDSLAGGDTLSSLPVDRPADE